MNLREQERERRTVGLKDALQIVSIVLMVAAIVWRGGQMTNQLDNIGTTVTRIEAQAASQQLQQARDGAEIRGLQERDVAHGQRLDDHDRRINQLERQRR